MQQDIDHRIKQAQRKGVGVYLLTGSITLLVLLGFVVWLFFVKGYQVIVTPNEAAEKAFIQLDSGIAWVGDSNIYTLGGEIKLSVSSPTFQPALAVINNQSSSTIEIQLLPSPAIILASAQSSDEAFQQWADLTQWFLNGSLVHVGAILEHSTIPGTYQIEVTHPYYKNVSQELILSRDQKLSLSPKLQIIEGTISVNSDPQGIDVALNGAIKGKTPIMLAANGGEHEIILASAQFETVTELIPLSGSFLHPKRNYQLAPKPGVLNVSVSPVGGLLLINNVEYQAGQISLAANKSHKVTYKKAGFSQFSKTVTVSAVQASNLSISLVPQFGELQVSSNVPASFKLNGKATSNSLMQGFSQQLPAVSHTIEASAPGYRSVKQSVSLKHNQQLALNINLLTEFDARRQEGLPLFVDQLGITMRRFRADPFTLGSPGNETGRRRNEHQIPVDFSRQFWVSETEVTQAQYAAFSGNSKNSSKLPITGVTWLQAAEYCNWLSTQEGLPVFYRFANGRYIGINVESRGYRLPTEAEWEWLAKKSKRAASTVYVWGNQEKLRDNMGNFGDKTLNGKQLIYFSEYEDGKTGLAEVASFKADRAGLYDLDGNVSEWVHDYYTNSVPNTSQTQIDYLGVKSGESWVIKGGNYETGRMRELRVAFREFSSNAKPTVGFRIARYHD